MEEEERDQREAKRVSIDGSRRFAPPRPAPAPAPAPVQHAPLLAPVQSIVAARPAALVAVTCLGSAAQDAYPSKPITLVVTYPPGGGADAMANLVFAEALSQSTFAGFIITVLVHTDMASPHLVRFNERIRIAGTLIADDLLATLQASELIFVALPSSALRSVLAPHAELLRHLLQRCALQLGEEFFCE